MEQGWLLDTNKLKAYKLDQLITDLCSVPTLKGKPKVLLIEEYGGGEYFALTREDMTLNPDTKFS